jgi:hypothetical protein
VKLDSLEKKNIFSTPEHFFRDLSSRIDSRLLEPNHSLKGTIYTIPQRYFELLQKAIENKTLKTAWAVNKKEQVFSTPDAYFEDLTEQILNKTANKNKVIKVDFGLKEWGYMAAAASVTLVLITLGVFYFTQEDNRLAQAEPETELTNMIASLEKGEVESYLDMAESFETQDILEFTSATKQKKIQTALEQEFIATALGQQDRETLEMNLQDIDISDIETDL